MSDLDRLLDLLPAWVLVGGKGGVGKTTCAAALASRAASRGERTLLLSTDPAGTLGDAIGATLDGTPREILARPGLFAAQLDPVAARDAFLARWRDVLVSILDRGTYLDEADIAGLVDAALPGLDETMALLTLLDLERDARWGRVILDTAPTGHTLRLLTLPDAFAGLLALLETMQAKHRFMVRALTHRYRADEADRFLDEMRTQLASLRATLTDPARTSVVLVTRPDALVRAETMRYAASLRALGLHLAAVVLNAVSDGNRELTELDAPVFEVPALAEPLVGLEGVERWIESFGTRSSGLGTRDSVSPHEARQRAAESRVPMIESRRGFQLDIRPLTIVGGKGGVGKTTVACALGVAAAGAARRVLVVSTDPAPSVADALEQAIGDEVTAVAGVEGLFAQQLDATAAFARFRERYEARVDEVFDAVLSGALDVAHDRRIARELLALAPPGIDELYALAALGETLAESRFDIIIVDPAPTGHLLRLLEMPEVALEWSHRILRLMLKYKELVGLGDAARELLEFSRRTRATAELLRDRARAGVLVVALDEPLVRGETSRLVARVRALGVGVLGVLWNRARGTVTPLPTMPPVAQFEAAESEPPPRGAEALRRWGAGWLGAAPTPS